MKYNVEAAVELIDLYESVTCESLNMALDAVDTKHISNALNWITGFGLEETCSLCASAKEIASNINDKCKHCINTVVPGTVCTSGKGAETYRALAAASTAEDIVIAAKARALYLRSLVDKVNESHKEHNNERS